MNIFIAGLTGATGQLLAIQLLNQGHHVLGFGRDLTTLPKLVKDHPNFKAEQGSLLQLSDEQLQQSLTQADAIACCLGHNLSFSGIWGHPRRLVTDAVKRLYQLAPARVKKFVLMNSNGVANQAAGERFASKDRLVVNLLRKVLPPHKDNEMAAAFLQQQGMNADKPWCIVRPDNLTDASEVSSHQAFASRQRGVVFDAGFTSRINVANFMAQLLIDETIWQQWQGQWPVLYNEEALPS